MQRAEAGTRQKMKINPMHSDASEIVDRATFSHRNRTGVEIGVG